MDEIELTELTDIEVTRQDAVRHPASGFPVLIMKALSPSLAEQAEDSIPDTEGCGCCPNCTVPVIAKDVNAVGGHDEGSDIDGATSAIQQIARLIESEARELAANGEEDEIYGIQNLLEAASMLCYFRQGEQWEDGDDGMMKSAGLVFKAHRKFSSDERKKLASEGKALEDGSYPIPDADALRRAAILARSGHGDVAAARKLIARRAKELGVKNPLSDNDAKKDAPESVTQETSAAETSAAADDVTKDRDAELIEKAKAEVRAESEGRIKALEEAMAVLKATPIPGQVSLAAPPAARAVADRDDLLQKAARYRRGAESNDRETSEYYKGKLAEVEKQLAQL